MSGATRPCPICGKPFVPIQKTHTYCSSACGKIARYRERNQNRAITNTFRLRDTSLRGARRP